MEMICYTKAILLFLSLVKYVKAGVPAGVLESNVLLRMQDMMEKMKEASETNKQCNNTVANCTTTVENLRAANKELKETVEALEAKNEVLNTTITTMQGKYFYQMPEFLKTIWTPSCIMSIAAPLSSSVPDL